MSPKPWDRLRERKKRREQEDDEENQSVTLDGDAHAWWAERENLERAYEPKVRGARDEAKSGDGKLGPSMFEEYFSTESLFTYGAPPRGSSEEATQVATDWNRSDPYVVLGLPESATWEQIAAAHRRLAKLHHPDRLLNATDDDREQSERRMRELNTAYSELRRRRGR